VIVPRWEWRTFGDDFGDAEAHFAALSTERVQETDEIYLLSLVSDASVKVRGGLMDVKRLEQVADGLEQWRPVLKAEFPLPAQDAGHVLEALGTGAAPSGRAEYDLAQLLDELVRPSPQLLVVEVHKVRRHFTVGGCRAEVSELRTDRGSRRTIAVESEDPGAVIAAVSGLGLSSRANVNVPRGLKALVGFGAKRYAVIDVGTNSVKFHIGERRADGEWQTLVDRAEVTRLGEGLEEIGRLGDEPIERTVAAITAMADEARQLEVEAIAAVGTAGLRIASNSSAFVEAVRERAGVELEVVSGDEEGRLAYLAVESELDLGDGSLVVFDSGGGSAQFTFGRRGHVDDRFSVDVGAVRITEQFGLDQAVSEDTLATALDEISSQLSRLDDRSSPDVLVGLGGAVTNLAAVMHELATYDPDVVQGSVLDRAEIDRQIDVYRTRSADEREEIVGLQPKRAEVILAGACIVRTVLEKLGCESLTVSDRGLRHGLLVDRFGSLESLGSKR
jgi:exopolyphosphatase / guanosine-5'-triphosphate,3'-diphosphate pyrophosphatase